MNPQRLRPGGESAGERGKTHPRLTLLTLDGFQARWPQAADLAKTSDGFGGGCASTGLSKRRRPLSKDPLVRRGLRRSQRQQESRRGFHPSSPSPFLPQKCFQRGSNTGCSRQVCWAGAAGGAGRMAQPKVGGRRGRRHNLPTADCWMDSDSVRFDGNTERSLLVRGLRQRRRRVCDERGSPPPFLVVCALTITRARFRSKSFVLSLHRSDGVF